MTPERQRDERLIDMIAARANGGSTPKVAARFGVSSVSITTQTNKVFDADLAESGEDRDAVSRAYWPRRK